MSETPWVFFFGDGKSEGDPADRALLGGKGAGLAEMTTLGLPVPPGFTISTEACRRFYQDGEKLPPGLESQMRQGLEKLEKATGFRLGDTKKPLLVSVRSGARASMPGMMDTILNLGLNDATAPALAASTQNPRFAYDSYRRLVAMYGDVVLGLKPETREEHDPFEVLLEDKKRKKGVLLDSDLDAEALKELVAAFKQLIVERSKTRFPEDPWGQLMGAAVAVFRSWNNARAISYRKMNNIPGEWGTAVNVQAMVFGNMGEDSGTGVAFTRDPSSGERRFFGEYLMNAQGEDVVAGVRTPLPVNGKDPGSLESRMPELYHQLEGVGQKLEAHFRDMQDIEFTIQQGKLWMLQCRSGKRTAKAAVKTAVDMVREKLIDKKEALLRVSPPQIDQLLHPTLDPKANRKVIARGLPASPGAATGKVVFFADDAEARARRGEQVVLVRIETSPEDVHGMKFSQGILTARGGMTSHAAVVARAMGRPCVVGTTELAVDTKSRWFVARGQVVKEGDVITIDGTSGDVILGQIGTVEAGASAEYDTLMAWADEVRRLRVRANADTPKDAETARRLGAEGVGLCRTEHMFFGPDRIVAMREMILADDEPSRRVALQQILKFQRSDFEAIFHTMSGLPVTVRLLDPPLHEFLPKEEHELRTVADALKKPIEQVRARLRSLEEVNPMLGLRGCRLGIVYPEIYDTQVRAAIQAQIACQEHGAKVKLEIMIPLVFAPSELQLLRKRTEDVAVQVQAEAGTRVEYTIGTMIEVPRAALLAGEIARSADFFSFGTNDLTQTTFGLSRDDSSAFLPRWTEEGLLADDPFVVLDTAGVGELIAIAAERGKKTKPNLKLGICGEHGGEERSVAFCHNQGLDYVSCSPYRVPIARLAAAQAALRGTK
jgi:pyruvate,orthophosphate dikinase